MKQDLETKRKKEKYIVSQMIEIYCHGKHKTKGSLCEKCQELTQYTAQRVDKCPMMETKTFCSNCKIHCYKPEMREQIRSVMRYSGPRILFYHPVMAVRHVIESKKEQKRLAKETNE